MWIQNSHWFLPLCLPCSEVTCPHLCLIGIMMLLEWQLSWACLHVGNLRNQFPWSCSWSSRFQPWDLRLWPRHHTAVLSHLDFYLSKGLDLIRGKQQARCMQGLPRASSIKWKTLCVWRLSNICIHTGGQAPESLGDGPASCHPHGFTPNKFCLQGRQTHGKKFRYPQCLSRAYSENKTDTLKRLHKELCP